MCCFSQHVERVAETNIFARSSNGRQYLVYSMSYAAAADLAMVLPLPVPPHSPEDAVRFISLESYPAFFQDLRRGFPEPTPLFSRGRMPPELAVAAAPLRMHDVGSFEASFVPRLDDFDRLDERFRIPRDIWNRLPTYSDYGFAVFKLKGSQSAPAGGVYRRLFGRTSPETRPDLQRVHPMAFEFPRRNPDVLYFPTVHIHDREVHSRAMFDHMLYCQPEPAVEEYMEDWQTSAGPAGAFVDVKQAGELIAADQPCRRRPLIGQLENKDTLIGKMGFVPQFVRA
jgi:hypothetical protein